MKTAAVLSLILLIVASAYLLSKWANRAKEQDSQENRSWQQDYFISTQGEDRNRANSVLPSEPSEDMSQLLQPPLAPRSPRKPDNENRDYLPNPSVQWIVHVDFQGGPPLSKTDLLKTLSLDWRRNCGEPLLFAFSPESEHWTYLQAAGGPHAYTKLKFSWHYYSTFTDPPAALTANLLNAYVQSISTACTKLGDASIRLETSPEAAETRADSLRQLVESSDKEIMVVLQAPPEKTFDGRDIWDVMLCLHLTWGDMDLFHWHNETDIGHDTFFSVWTSTYPGYFLPESIAAGELRAKNLVFGFSLPRSADPLKVFGEMLKAARYAQARLGGVLLDATGQELSEAKTIALIKTISQRLTQAGFAPGSDASLLLF